MIGLSISPVIHGVVTTLISLAVGVVGVLAGIEGWRDREPGERNKTDREGSSPHKLVWRRSRRLDVTPWPLTCL